MATLGARRGARSRRGSLDIRVLAGTGAVIKREEIEEGIAAIHTRPMVHSRRVLLIEEAERLVMGNSVTGC